jgi:hypothetical protein
MFPGMNGPRGKCLATFCHVSSRTVVSWDATTITGETLSQAIPCGKPAITIERMRRRALPGRSAADFLGLTFAEPSAN